MDTKTIEAITDHEVGKMLNYLKVTGLRVGLIIDFKHAKLEWKRVVRSSVVAVLHAAELILFLHEAVQCFIGSDKHGTVGNNWRCHHSFAEVVRRKDLPFLASL